MHVNLPFDGNFSDILNAIQSHNDSVLANFTNINDIIVFPDYSATVNIDITKSGLRNDTYRTVSIVHILGDTPPDNDASFKDEFYKKVSFLIDVPENMTNSWLIYWIKKVGNPTGYLNISINGEQINSTDVSTLSTSYTKIMLPFGIGNITDNYIVINFNGTSGWTQANDVIIGAGAAAGSLSEESTDGATWEHPIYELIMGLTIEYNQKAIADQLNEESIIISKTFSDIVCPGQSVLATISIKDYQGSALDITTIPRCKVVEIMD